MIAYARHLAALRTRLLTDPDLMGILGNDPTRIHLKFIYDVLEPQYPCVTISQVGAQDAVQFPRTYDPARIMFDTFVRKSDQSELCMQMSERIFDLVHTQKTRCSTADACFHEIKRIDEMTPSIDEATNSWRQTSIYQARVTVR